MPRHVDTSRDFYFILSERAAHGRGGRGRCHFFSSFFSSFFPPVQQTTSGIGRRVKYFFRVGNQSAACEKQQQQTTFSPITGGCSEGLGVL